MTRISISLMVFLLTGCSSFVPASKIRYGGASLHLPKNLTAKNVELTFRQGTNSVTFKADFLTTKNDPQVISAAGEVQAEVIRAHYEGMGIVGGKIVEAAGKAVK